MGKVDPKQILGWIQVGEKMTSFVIDSFDHVKAAIAAGGGTPDEQNAALDRTHALYQTAIAHEQAIIDAAKS